MSVRHTRVTADRCPIREVLSRIGDKWSVLVVILLGDGTRRFGELKRSIDGISQRMLTLTLRGLERDGMVTRTAYPTIPPRVEYQLTRLGKTLLEPIQSLADWAEKRRPDVQAAQRRYDLRAGTGQRTVKKGTLVR